MTRHDVLVVAQYAGTPGKTENRFRELCAMLVEHGLEVELVTTDFHHGSKEHITDPPAETPGMQVTYLPEPGYSSNVSFRRIHSHRQLAKNLAAYLEGRKTPDVIYCAFPSPVVAEVAAAYARRRGVRFILDVQDLWPEAFEMVLKPKRLARAALSPMRKKVDELYRSADAVVTVSETYSDRVARVRGGAQGVATVYLGINLEQSDAQPADPYPVPAGAISLAYIGTFGHSYDLPLVFDALRILKDQGVDVVLHMMGGGPLESAWRTQAQDLSETVQFHGRLPYPEMVSRLRGCDIALNPIVPGSAASIINKVCDYAAVGLPVINTQESEEYRALLTRFKAGVNCRADASEVASAIAALAQDPERRRRLQKGSRQLAETHFDRARTYRTMVGLIDEGLAATPVADTQASAD